MRGGVIILLTLLLTVQNALAVTEAQRLEAIQRIQTYLLSQQDPLTAVGIPATTRTAGTMAEKPRWSSMRYCVAV